MLFRSAYNQFTNEPLLNEKSPYCNDDAPRYDQSKRDAQLYILANVSDAMHTVVLNPTSVTGPPDYRPSLAGKGMIDMCNNKVPSLINGGFDFCDVRDVAAGIVSAFEKGRNGENYLLSGHWHHLSEMHAMIMDAMGNQKKLPVLPIWTAYAGLPFISL